MKIVYIASRSLNEIGGIETYMKNLLTELSKKKHDIILYCEGKRFDRKKYNGFDIIEIPGLKNKFLNKILLGAFATFHSVLFNKEVDIYHYNANAAAITSFIPRLLGKIVVYQGHGLEWKRAKWSILMQKSIHYLDDFVIYINNNITMVSEEQSNYILTHYGKHSVTINSGVNIDFVKYDEALIAKFNLLPEEYILYLGRLVPEKRADILIEAFLKLEEKNLKLVIAGDDPNETSYINQLKDNSKENINIVFTGAVFNDEKNALLQHCKIFCIPSELEGLPITLLEAMSYGKLCIASNIEANKEALAECGLYFDVNNSQHLAGVINDSMKNYNMYKYMRNSSIQRIDEKFTWKIISNKFEEYYNSLL